MPDLDPVFRAGPTALYRCAFDAHWTPEFISEEIAAITGYPESDFIGRRRSYTSVIYPEDRAVVQASVREAIRQRRPYRVEYRIVHADGRLRQVAERGEAACDERGRVLYLIGEIVDVTRLRPARMAV